jgi:hypothetical protein
MTNLSSVGRTDSEKDRRTRNSDCLDHGGQRRDCRHQSSAGGFRSLANGPSLRCAFLYPCPATGDSHCLRSCSDDQAKRHGRRSPHPLGASAAGIKISHRAREEIIGFSFLRESKVLWHSGRCAPKVRVCCLDCTFRNDPNLQEKEVFMNAAPYFHPQAARLARNRYALLSTAALALG